MLQNAIEISVLYIKQKNYMHIKPDLYKLKLNYDTEAKKVHRALEIPIRAYLHSTSVIA